MKTSAIFVLLGLAFVGSAAADEYSASPQPIQPSISAQGTPTTAPGDNIVTDPTANFMGSGPISNSGESLVAEPTPDELMPASDADEPSDIEGPDSLPDQEEMPPGEGSDEEATGSEDATSKDFLTAAQPPTQQQIRERREELRRTIQTFRDGLDREIQTLTDMLNALEGQAINARRQMIQQQLTQARQDLQNTPPNDPNRPELLRTINRLEGQLMWLNNGAYILFARNTITQMRTALNTIKTRTDAQLTYLDEPRTVDQINTAERNFNANRNWMTNLRTRIQAARREMVNRGFIAP